MLLIIPVGRDGFIFIAMLVQPSNIIVVSVDGQFSVRPTERVSAANKTDELKKNCGASPFSHPAIELRADTQEKSCLCSVWLR